MCGYEVFHTRLWDDYLSSLGKRHIVLSIADSEGLRIGFSSVLKWIGIRIIGSPSGGSSTFVQGLCLNKGIEVEERMHIYQELVAFFFIQHLVGYIQISDWRLKRIFKKFRGTFHYYF